jgi:hypothetical protein
MVRRGGWVLGFALLGCGREEDQEVVVPETPLSQDNFAEKFGERFCEDLGNCNPTAPCYPDDVESGNDTGCVYDQAAAERCMDAVWPCVSEAATPFLEIPVFCEEVWVCD